MQISASCRRLVLVTMVFASLAISAHAQNIFGSIIGTVTDPGDAVLPAASVTVTNLGTGEKRIATTDGQGNYQVLSLPRGDYKVEVDAAGFKQFVRSPIDVVRRSGGTRQRADGDRRAEPAGGGECSSADYANRQRVAGHGGGR